MLVIANILFDIRPLNHAHSLLYSLQKQEIIIHVFAPYDNRNMIEVALSNLPLYEANTMM